MKCMARPPNRSSSADGSARTERDSWLVRCSAWKARPPLYHQVARSQWIVAAKHAPPFPRYPEIAVTTGLGDGVTILRNVTTPPVGTDNDGNGVLDDCERAVFRRGDWNQDGQFNLSDAISLVDYLFRGGERFPFTKAGDADDSGRLNITDPIRIVLHLFRGGAAPAAPFPACGKDPTGDSLSCIRFGPCE